MAKKNKGDVTVLLLYCVFNNNGESITHFMNSEVRDIELAQGLPNTFSVLIANNDEINKKKIVGGFVIKTSFTDSISPKFLNMCIKLVNEKIELKNIINAKSSFLASKVGIRGAAPLSEDDMVRHLAMEFLKKSVSGNA